MNIMEFIEEANKCETKDALFRLFSAAMRQFGYERIAYGALSSHDQFKTNLPEPALVLNYPDDWVRHYFEKQYQKVDPVVRFTPSIRKLYLWKDLKDLVQLSRPQLKLLKESRDAGLRSGLSVPLHGPFGETFVISLATEEAIVSSPIEIQHINLFCIQFHLAFTELSRGEARSASAVKLTRRERECLIWSARGKSSYETSCILNISEHTVNFHIRNAMNKLCCSSRVSTVVNEIRLGLIDP